MRQPKSMEVLSEALCRYGMMAEIQLDIHLSVVDRIIMAHWSSIKLGQERQNDVPGEVDGRRCLEYYISRPFMKIAHPSLKYVVTNAV